MSNTPRTDSMRGFHGLDTAVDAEFSEQLECELNTALTKIVLLEKAGDELLEWLTIDGVSLSNQRLLANQWYRAKGVKK